MNKQQLTYIYRTLTHIDTATLERTPYVTCTITERHSSLVLGVGVGADHADAQLRAELEASCAFARAARDDGRNDE